MRILFSAVLLTLAACVQPAFSQAPLEGSSQELSDDSISPLVPEDPTAHQLADIREQLGILLRKVDFIELQLSSTAGSNVAALLDPARPDKLGTIETELGSFLVRIVRLEPYVSAVNPETNGYRLTLEIGNLSPATYRGFTVAATWSGRDYLGLRYTQQVFDDALRPSIWNQVSLTLPSTSSHELVNLTIGLEVDSVSFDNDLEGVLATLARYERAYREQSISQLVAVYPSQPDPQTVEAIFQTADSIQISLTPVGEPIIDGENASVDALRSVQQDGLAPVEGPVTLDLRRSGPEWIIDAIRLQ